MTLETKREIAEWVMWFPVVLPIVFASIELIAQKVWQWQYAREDARQRCHKDLIKLVDKLDLMDDAGRDDIMWCRYLYKPKGKWWRLK